MPLKIDVKMYVKKSNVNNMLFAVRKIDFGKIDYVKLILIKIELKINRFMFGYIQWWNQKKIV
jgi:hypothetical protein